QVFQFCLNFGPDNVDGLGLASRIFKGQLVFLQVDFGDFQLNLHLTVGFAARVVAAGGGTDFAGALDSAWQAFVDIGVEVGGDGTGDLDVDLIADFQITEVFRLIGQLYMDLTTFRPFQDNPVIS